MADITTSPMPTWLDGSHISPEWMNKVANLGPCSSCSAVDISNETRKADLHAKDGATLRIIIHGKDTTAAQQKPLIIKQVPDQGLGLSKRLGLAREALFYHHFSSKLPRESTPIIHYSYGDFAKGEKCIIMEDVQDAVDSGILFGPGNPNNWNRDLPALISQAGWNNHDSPAPSSREVALLTFREIAKIHAVFWRNDKELLLTPDKTWLRGQEWLQGKGRDSWEASQDLVRNFWIAYLEAEKKSNEPIIQWNDNVRKAVEKAVANISWEAQLKRLNVDGYYTLVHGDFWPGNVLWMTKEERYMIKLLDWEMVGLGSGPQDLGQYVISNMDPVERKGCERELIEAYHRELNNQSIDVPFEYCWREYQVGGVERWLWFLVYFLGNGMAEWAYFFHNQISAFMADHKLTADDITQPRP